MACARCGELEQTVERLRAANRRLQAEGPALERDKLIVELRAALALQAQERVEVVTRLKFLEEIHTQLDDSPRSFYVHAGRVIAEMIASLPSAAAPVKENR